MRLIEYNTGSEGERGIFVYNLVGLQLASQLSDTIPWALTAVFSAAQTYLACEANARYIIPYVNRTTHLCGDGLALVYQMASIVERVGSGTEIVAASLKTPAEVVEAILNGAYHVTIPLPLIEEMAEHKLSALAIEEFARATADQDVEDDTWSGWFAIRRRV